MKYTKHVLVTAFVIASLTDLITAVTAGNSMRETNPFYTMTGNWWLISFMKIGVTLAIVSFAFPKKGFNSERSYYMLILILVFGTITYGMGAYTNIEVGHINEEYYATQPVPSTDAKIEYYNDFAWTYYFLPLLTALFPFLMFEWSAPYQNFKKRRLVKK